MAKTVKWSVSGKEIDAQEPDAGYTPYEGELPRKGVYHFRPEFMRATKFQSGNSGLTLLWKLVPTSKAQKKYKDCPLWDRLVDVKQNAWKLRQFLDSIGAEGSDWAKTRIDGENDDVVAFGRVKLADIEDVKIMVTIGADDSGNERLEVARYLPLVDDEDADDEDDDDEEYDDEEDSDADDDEDDADEDEDDESDDEDEDDDSDEDGDEDEDEDDDDEPEPPARGRRGAAKKAPAKAAKKATPAKRSAPASKKAAPAKASKKAARRRSGDDAPF